MGLMQKIKAVFNRMFGVNEVRDIFGIEVSRSSDMQTALDLYKGMRSGLPTWCMDGTIKPTRFSNVICREIANLTLFNVNVEIDGNDALKKKFDEVLNALQEKQEESCATCGMMIKTDGQGIEFLDPDYFIITDTNTNGDVLAAVFFSYIKKGNRYYTKAEYHRFEDVNGERVYKISSKAFKSEDKNRIGSEISLEKVDEWKALRIPLSASGKRFRRKWKQMLMWWKTSPSLRRLR